MSPTPPPVSGVLETSLYVRDPNAARDFYARVFGFETLFADSRMAAMAAPGIAVLLLFREGATLHPSPTPGGVIPPHGATGGGHLCFAIPRGAAADWEAHLAAAGIAIESRVTWSAGGTSLYFRDPDGNSLEVATPGLWAIY